RDFVIGEQLARCVTGGESDLHLFPDRVEPIARNSVDDRYKRLASRQSRIGLINKVERRIMLKEGAFRCRREFHENNIEQIAVVKGGYGAGNAVTTPSLRG